MPAALVADRSAAPPPPATAEPPAVAIVPGWEPAALTPRGTAAARLGAFQDVWGELDQADRAWFASWLNDLLIDAVLGLDGAPA